MNRQIDFTFHGIVMYVPREIAMKIYIPKTLHDILCVHHRLGFMDCETGHVKEEAGSDKVLCNPRCKLFNG